MIFYVVIASLVSGIALYCYYNLTYTEVKCGWKSINHRKLNDSIKKSCDILLDGVKNLNVAYFIGFGTELQAYRDGFLNYMDHDIDIMVPIWLNQHIFGCNEYKSVNQTKWNNTSIKISDKYKICNNSFSYYQKMFHRYIRSLKIKDFRHVLRYPPNIQIHMDGVYGKYYLDTWLMISNEWTYRDIDICECEFCGRSVKCLQNPLKSILINYGRDWMITKSKPGVEALYIDSID